MGSPGKISTWILRSPEPPAQTIVAEGLAPVDAVGAFRAVDANRVRTRQRQSLEEPLESEPAVGLLDTVPYLLQAADRPAPVQILKPRH